MKFCWSIWPLAIFGLVLAIGMVSSCTRSVPPEKPHPAIVQEPVNATTAPEETAQKPENALIPPVPEPVPACVRLEMHEKRAMLARLDLKQQGFRTWEALRPALERSRRYLRKKPGHKPALQNNTLTCTYGDLLHTIEQLLRYLPTLDEHPEYLADMFDWYRLEPATLMTGYYEPLVQASPAPCPEYPFPLYGVPRDLQVADLGAFHHRWAGQHLIYRIEKGTIRPYYDRKAIDSRRVLADQGVEIAWVRNLVDIFFLQIQGSGRLIFPDGSVRHVLYAGKNGRKYVSLGKVLLQKGYMSREEMSMQGIKAFLQQHPAMVQSLLNTNPSYVFFRLANKGPYGAMGEILTPFVSLASDPHQVPLGSLLVHQVCLPTRKAQDVPKTFVGLPQDRGGAIKGDRLDLFCGAGDLAAFIAGHMQEEARVCLLLCRDNK